MKLPQFNQANPCLLISPLLVIICSSVQLHASNPTNIYSTGFEAAEAYNRNFDLVGQNGWVGAGSGGNGLVTNFFPGLGQQAYIGFAPPNPGYDMLNVWRPINLVPDLTNRPIVKFSVMMEIDDSTNGQYDDFYWSVYNAQGHRLFTLDFDNFNTRIYYALDDTNGFISTGKFFTNNRPHSLVIAMNFTSNKWSATLDANLLVTNKSITKVGASLNLGDVDAVWFIFTPGAPGNNFMLFDNYQITAESLLPTPVRLQSLGRTGDGQFILRLTGDAGCSYVIEGTTNLVNWSALKTNNATDGTFDFVDSAATNFSRRFYRARQVP
ncbi:MAG: hypothetical protein HY298_14250 [Verrucomicrobia bacterium]|nr:hypothetical protein [Verrucomicrobiota bacterium]